MRVEAAGAELHVTEQGTGDAVVLVHGMAATAADWDATALPGRVIAYDRRGYGTSGAPEPYTRTTASEQAEDLAAVVRALDAAPAVLVGADVGALAVLDVLLRHHGLAKAAVLIDPPLYAFVPEATLALSDERALLEDALRSGGGAHAVEAWLGPDADPVRAARASATPRAFFADYGALATLALTRGELRAIDVPLRVVTSQGAPPHVAAAAAALVDVAPAASAAGTLRDALSALA
jgi:pimeloyl-ACP methyl ester carboxylesterase